MQLKDIIYALKKKYGTDVNNIRIASTTSHKFGIDNLVQKYSLEFGFTYNCFTVYHERAKLYDLMPAYMFNKKYHPINYIMRDNHAIKWANVIFIFVSCENINYMQNARIQRFITNAKKQNKICEVIKG